MQARTRAAELAVHYAQGLEPARGLVYWRYAGETALRRYAYPEALAHCTAGIETAAALPPTPAVTTEALALWLTLGATRLATEGFAAPAVAQAYHHAYGLAQELGDTPQLFPALYGLGGYYRVRAEFGTSYALMQRLMQVAQDAADPALLLMAHFALGGMLRYWRDGLVQARWHLEQSLALYDPAQHSTLAARYGLYPQVSSLANLATLLWQLGYPEQAHHRRHEAVTLAQAADSPFDVTVALAYDAFLLQMDRALPQAQAQSEAVLALAAQHGFAHWVHSCGVLHGWGLAIQGQTEDGLGQIRQGLEHLSARGVRLLRP
jgi:predicted ATPase